MNLESFSHRSFQISLLLLTALIPFDNLYLSWSLIAAVLFFVLSGWRYFTAAIRSNAWVIWFILFFATVLGGYFYSVNRDEAIFKIVQKTAIVVIPVMIAGSVIISPVLRRRIFQTMVVSLLVLCIYLEVSAVIQFVNHQTLESFYYTALARHLHPTYLALLLNIAILFLLVTLIQYNRNVMVLLTVATVFTIVVIQLSSRAGMLGLGLVWCVLIAALIHHFERKKVYPIAGILIVSMLIAFSIARKDRLASITNQSIDLTESKDQIATRESGQVRILIWRRAFELIGASPWIGYGTGDANDILYKSYRAYSMDGAFESRLNAHNQYLQTWLSTGITSLLCMVIILFLGITYSIKNKDWVALGITLLIAFNFFFESMLERRQGLFIFALFLPLCFASKRLQDNETLERKRFV